MFRAVAIVAVLVGACESSPEHHFQPTHWQLPPHEGPQLSAEHLPEMLRALTASVPGSRAERLSQTEYALETDGCIGAEDKVGDLIPDGVTLTCKSRNGDVMWIATRGGTYR